LFASTGDLNSVINHTDYLYFFSRFSTGRLSNGVWISDNNGQTWVPIPSTQNELSNDVLNNFWLETYCIDINPSNNNILAAGTINGLHISNNALSDVEEIDFTRAQGLTGRISSVKFSPDGTTLFAVSGGILSKCTNVK
jgi:WD40 repeat protein